MTISGVEQFQYDVAGLILNGAVATTGFVDLTTIQGLDSAPVRSSSNDREGTSGGFVDSEYESVRSVILEGMIYVNPNAMETYLDQLKANYAPSSTNKQLTFMTDAGLRCVFGKSQGFRYDKTQLRRTGQSECQVTVMCEDPRIYDTSVTTASTTLGTATTTGRGFPKGYTFGYGAASTQNGLNLVLSGNRSSPGTLTINGPVVNPVIVNDDTSTTMSFNITLVAGDSLVIDLNTKSVLLNGVTSRRNSLSITAGKWFRFKAGSNNIRFQGTQSPATPLATLVASARSAWR